MSEFWKLYRHPEWQKKRLEVMQVANFVCQECGGRDETLNVHHTYYLKNHKPWEYPTESLQCLCEPCHQLRHTASDALKLLIGELGQTQLENLTGYVKGIILLQRAHPHDNSRFSIHSWEEAAGVADAYRRHADSVPERVIEALAEDSTISHSELNTLFNPRATKAGDGK